MVEGDVWGTPLVLHAQGKTRFPYDFMRPVWPARSLVDQEDW